MAFSGKKKKTDFGKFVNTDVITKGYATLPLQNGLKESKETETDDGRAPKHR